RKLLQRRPGRRFRRPPPPARRFRRLGLRLVGRGRRGIAAREPLGLRGGHLFLVAAHFLLRGPHGALRSLVGGAQVRFLHRQIGVVLGGVLRDALGGKPFRLGGPTVLLLPGNP